MHGLKQPVPLSIFYGTGQAVTVLDKLDAVSAGDLIVMCKREISEDDKIKI